MKIRDIINQLKQYDPEKEIPIFFENSDTEYEFDIDHINWDVGETIDFQPIVEAHVVEKRNKKEDKEYKHIIKI